MAKGQLRSNKEVKKPKKPQQPVPPWARLSPSQKQTNRPSRSPSPQGIVSIKVSIKNATV